jgi:hypothetical protein
MSAVLQEVPPQDLSVTLAVTEDIRRELQQTGRATAAATALIIDSPDMAQIAADEMNECKHRITRVEALYKGFIEPAKKIIAHAQSIFNPRLEDDRNAEVIYKQKIGAWQEVERKRIAVENAEREAAARKIRQEAEAKAAAEQARAAQQAAEARRKQQEAEEAQRKAQAEGNARAAAAAAAAAAKAQEQANQALENGAARAQQVQLEAAAQVSVAPVAEQVKIAGAQMRDNWVAVLSAKDEDEAKAMIVAAVAARPDLLAYLTVNTKAINQSAKAQKKAMNIPGYVAENQPIVAGSRK